jgi:hypothetical protein
VRIEYPRYGLGAGKHFVILGLAPDFQNNSVELNLWG